jgi:hypothetical protein
MARKLAQKPVNLRSVCGTVAASYPELWKRMFDHPIAHCPENFRAIDLSTCDWRRASEMSYKAPVVATDKNPMAKQYFRKARK